MEKTIKYQKFENWNELPEDEKKLLEEALKARESSHCQYSNFHVGAAGLLKDGQIIHGSNFENAAYGSTTCAEVSLINSINANSKIQDLEKIAVIASPKDRKSDIPISPCGNCRQVLAETESLIDKEITLLFSCDNQETIKLKGIRKNLLPFSFSSTDL